MPRYFLYEITGPSAHDLVPHSLGAAVALVAEGDSLDAVMDDFEKRVVEQAREAHADYRAGAVDGLLAPEGADPESADGMIDFDAPIPFVLVPDDQPTERFEVNADPAQWVESAGGPVS